MRKSARIAALVAGPIMILGIGAATAAPAFASPGPGSNGQTNTGTGNSITYTNGTFPDSGLVFCNETQHPKFDTVECHGPGVQLQAFEGQTLTVPWLSDFGSGPHAGQTGVLTYTVSADGLSYSGQATYSG
jgi:hypothetical protein